MLKKDVVVGQVYVAKISGKLTRIRIDSECEAYTIGQGGYSGRPKRKIGGGWMATNLNTGRQVRIKSAAKLRLHIPQQEKIKSVADFVRASNTLNRDGIYNLIENGTDNAIRDEILEMADKDSPEPFRNAFNKLGKKYGVPSLITY